MGGWQYFFLQFFKKDPFVFRFFVFVSLCVFMCVTSMPVSSLAGDGNWTPVLCKVKLLLYFCAYKQFGYEHGWIYKLSLWDLTCSFIHSFIHSFIYWVRISLHSCCVTKPFLGRCSTQCLSTSDRESMTDQLGNPTWWSHEFYGGYLQGQKWLKDSCITKAHLSPTVVTKLGTLEHTLQHAGSLALVLSAFLAFFGLLTLF